MHDLRKDPQVKAMQADTTPETSPRSATARSTQRYGRCGADHRNGRVYMGCRYFSFPRDAGRIRVLTAARRVREPGGRTSGETGATSDPLAARRSRVTPGRSPRTTRRGSATRRGAPARGPTADPGGSAGRRSAGGIDRDGTVTAATPPWRSTARDASGRCAGPAGGTSSAPRYPVPHRSSVPVAHG